MLIQEHIALGEIMFCNIRTDNTAEMFTMFLILKQVSCVQTKMECEKERGKSVSDRIMASVRYSADENVCIVLSVTAANFVTSYSCQQREHCYVSLHPTQTQLYLLLNGVI